MEYERSEMLDLMVQNDIIFQDRGDGKWYNGLKEDVDLTPYLVRCGLLLKVD